MTESFGKDDGIVNIEVLTVTDGENGDIVLGTDGGGIYVISGSELRHLGTEDGLLSDVVMRIKHDPYRNIFWIVTSNSIAYMTADYQIVSIRNFPYSNNFDLYENSEQDVWVLASNGIYVVPADELLENGEISPVYYGRANGLPCIATANSYSELTDNGDLYMASTTGVAKVNIEIPFENVNDLKVAVPYIDVDGVRIYPDENGCFTVPPDAQKVTISSFVFNYSLMNPQISYYLEGFEEENAAISRSELVPVDYTNLKGGTYAFVMRLKDSMGRGNKEVSVQIVKEKAYYEKLWFMVMTAVAVLLILGLSIQYYVRLKTKTLEKKQQETMTFVREITEAFAKVIDMKDTYTNGHSSRVAKYTALLAKELGYDEETVEKYYRIALLHDVGKIGIPPEVLNKPGKLTDEEFQTIKSHVDLGYNTLKDISIMPELAVGAQAHHERPDGKGYPNHLKGEEIPRVAQIIGVADCFDAMYSNRPYRNRMNFDKVVSIMKHCSSPFTEGQWAEVNASSDAVHECSVLLQMGLLRRCDRGRFRTYSYRFISPSDLEQLIEHNEIHAPRGDGEFWNQLATLEWSKSSLMRKAIAVILEMISEGMHTFSADEWYKRTGMVFRQLKSLLRSLTHKGIIIEMGERGQRRFWIAYSDK